MRKIKFRVWNYTDKEFIINENVKTTIQMLEFFRYSTSAIMQQYTGLKDKHGKDIYEGDIVKFDDGEIAEIVFFCGAFMPKLEKGAGININYDDNPVWQDGEVIGNIYENPELLGGVKMSNFVIFKKLKGSTFAINKKDLSLIEFLSDNIIHFPSVASSNKYELKKHIQPKEQVFFLRNIIKAIDGGFVDFTDDKLYDFSFENMRAKDAGGVNNKFIDSDLKAEYKKELDFYYQKMLNLIIENNDLKFAEFMYKMSDFFAKVLSESKFNETPFELREKFYNYLTDIFVL